MAYLMYGVEVHYDHDPSLKRLLRLGFSYYGFARSILCLEKNVVLMRSRLEPTHVTMLRTSRQHVHMYMQLKK